MAGWGAVDYGAVDWDRIVLDGSSMWSGGSYEANKYDIYLHSTGKEEPAALI
jgi:hypothetical protein